MKSEKPERKTIGVRDEKWKNTKWKHSLLVLCLFYSGVLTKDNTAIPDTAISDMRYLISDIYVSGIATLSFVSTLIQCLFSQII